MIEPGECICHLIDLNFKDCFITNSSTDFNNISHVEFTFNRMSNIQFIN